MTKLRNFRREVRFVNQKVERIQSISFSNFHQLIPRGLFLTQNFGCSIYPASVPLMHLTLYKKPQLTLNMLVSTHAPNFHAFHPERHTSLIATISKCLPHPKHRAHRATCLSPFSVNPFLSQKSRLSMLYGPNTLPGSLSPFWPFRMISHPCLH